MRFTSLAAWIPVGLILVMRSTSKIRTLLGLCAPFGLFGVILGCCIDRWFYGFWAIPFLGNIHFNVLLGKSAVEFAFDLNKMHLTLDSSYLRSWVTLWNAPLFLVCLCWCSCHLWSHAALFYLGDVSNQIRSSITTAMDHRSIYSFALVFRAQGDSFHASGVAPHLYIGWSRLKSIG